MLECVPGAQVESACAASIESVFVSFRFTDPELRQANPYAHVGSSIEQVFVFTKVLHG